uniref:HAT C-terminal dimerisation domain-containing protein n=1 Tax=Meloidogyne incognita TaxID=6306 RepID=A0A914MVL1_MELIC
MQILHFNLSTRSDNIIDPFLFWKTNSEKWKRLTSLFRKFNSPPVGSQESERLFSTAGITLSELRNRLTGGNLEKLLFLHHNLPLYDFSY